MYMTQPKYPGQRGLAIGLAVLGLLVPVATVFLSNEPLGSFDDPSRASYYRYMVAALLLGMASEVGAFIGSRGLTPLWLRRLSAGLALLGLLVSLYWLGTLIGLCGTGSILGACQP